jgi:PIN domain nuclease of toxin-antitoxin system
MRLLLDTHILLALIERRMAGLPTGVQALLRHPDNEHHLSAASLWEIAIKSRLGKLRLRPSLNALPELLDSLGIAIVSINVSMSIETGPQFFIQKGPPCERAQAVAPTAEQAASERAPTAP